MATKYDVGAKIGLEGDVAFKGSLRDIDAGLKLLTSEMKVTQTQFEGQDKSMQALTKTHEVLERTLYTQRDKVDALEAAVAKSAQTFGESSNNTMRLQKELNYANVEVMKTERNLQKTSKEMADLAKKEEGAEKSTGFLQNALARLTGQMKNTDRAAEDTSAAMKKADDSSKGLGDALGDVGNKIGVSLPPQISGALNKMMQIGPASMAAVAGFAAVAAAIVSVEKKLIDLTIAQAASVDNLLTLSDTSGLDTKILQEYQYAAELVDVSVDTLVSSQEKLIRNMASAQRGSKAQAEAFVQLGVTYRNTDGTLRDTQETFWDVIDALGRVNNETQRDALAMQLMGKSARDLNPIIKAGSDQLKEYGKEANAMGYVLDTKALNALGAVDDAMQRFNNSTEAAKKQIAAQFAPYVEESLTKITKIVNDLGKAFADSGIVDSFGMVLKTVTDIIAPTDKYSEETVPKLTKALRPLAMVLATIADTLNIMKGLSQLFNPFLGISDRVSGAKTIGTALGFGKGSGNPSNVQGMYDLWLQTDINAATKKAGYGQYYEDGVWYSNYDEYLRSVFGKSNHVGTFEHWKLVNGYNATGNSNWRGGWTWVGENGPERVMLPQGSQIQSATESRETGSGDTYNFDVHIDSIDNLETLLRMAREARMRERKKGLVT